MTKTIPFDLNKFLAGAKVMTRDGRQVGQVTYFDRPAYSYPIHGIVDGLDTVGTWTRSGYFVQGRRESPTDLVIVEEPSKPINDSMIPFDLNKFLAGAKPITRNGIPVEQLTYFPSVADCTYPLRGVIPGVIGVESWTIDGLFHCDGKDRDYDLLLLADEGEKEPINNEAVGPMTLATALGLYRGDGDAPLIAAFVDGIHAAEKHYGIAK